MRPPGIGRGNARRCGKTQRQTGGDPRGEKAETLRLQRVAIPADGFHWLDRRGRRSRSDCMIAGLCRPPPETSQRRGGAGSRVAATAAAMKATSVAAPSAGESASTGLIAPAHRRNPAGQATWAPAGRNRGDRAAAPAPRRRACRRRPAPRPDRNGRRCGGRSNRPAGRCRVRYRRQPASRPRR